MAGRPKKRAREEEEAQELLRKLSDPFYRFQTLYNIKSEDTGQIIPFTPYPEQMDVANAIHRDGFQRLIIPKARRRGMSTGIGVLMFDLALRSPGYEAGIVDRNGAEATKKLENVIKISRDQLPPFMKADIKNIKDNDDQISFAVRDDDGKFDTTSHIYASTSYRGGNCNFLHVSEWGWIQCEDPKRSEEIQTGAIQAARKGITIVETTWKGGKHGHLWDYTKLALETPEHEKHARSWRVLFFPWHTDPVYSLESTAPIRRECEDYFQELEHEHAIKLTIGQKRWYQDEAWPLQNNRFGEYPSTLDECFKSPMPGVIYEDEMSRMMAERRITSIPLERGMPVFVACDLGRNDAMPMLFIQVIGKEVRVIDYYVSHREAISHYGQILKDWMTKNSVNDLRVLLPHDGGRKSLETGKTIVEKFQELGFRNTQYVPRIPRVWNGINHVKETFPYLYFDKRAIEKPHKRGTKEFPSFRECVENYHQAPDKNNQMMSMEPVHDEFSHGCDALRTFCEAWQGGHISKTFGRAVPDFGEFGDDMDSSSGKTYLAGSGKWRR